MKYSCLKSLHINRMGSHSSDLVCNTKLPLRAILLWCGFDLGGPRLVPVVDIHLLFIIVTLSLWRYLNSYFWLCKLFNWAIISKCFIEPLLLAVPPACRSGSESSRSLKKPRAAPSPTPPSSAATTLRNGQRQHSEHNSSSDDDHRNSPDEPVRIYIYSDSPV